MVVKASNDILSVSISKVQNCFLKRKNKKFYNLKTTLARYCASNASKYIPESSFNKGKESLFFLQYNIL